MTVGDLLRRVMRGRWKGKPRLDPGRFRTEIVHHYRAGRLDRATSAARRLVAWQRETLGERHPDHATGLMNLARLLKLQGQSEDALPLVAQALAIRMLVMDKDHPDVVASQVLLQSLQSARPDPPPRPDSPNGVKGLAVGAGPAIRRPGALEAAWETRRRALGLIDWVLALSTRPGADHVPLREVLDHARSLRAAIATARLGALSAEAISLSSDVHPLSSLLRLAALGDQLDDTAWEDLRTAVSAHFGKAVSGALARGRIVFREPNAGRASCPTEVTAP